MALGRMGFCARCARPSGSLWLAISAALRFDEVVVDLGAAVLEVAAEFVPLVEGVADGGSGEAGGAVLVAGLQFNEPGFEALHDGGAVLLALGVDFLGRGGAVSELGFDAVELLYLGEHPLGVGAFGFGFKELPSRVGEAADEGDAALSVGELEQGVIGAVAIALDDADEVFGDDVVEMHGSASGAPDEEADFAHGVVDDP